MNSRYPAHALRVLGPLCIVLLALVPSSCDAATEASKPGDLFSTLLRSPFQISQDGNTTQTPGRADMLWELVSSLLPPTDGANELEIIEKQLEWKHDLVLWVLPDSVTATLPELVKSWMANYKLGSLLYLVLGAMWCFFTYVVFKNTRAGIREENIPSYLDLLAQIKVSMGAIPLYTMLPPFAEYFIKNGYTLAYGKVESVGWGMYCAYFVLYMASVEFGVYWMHRKLHELRLGYKYLHSTHHVYNKENTLSPFAGLAFHPLDGMLQAIPYVWSLGLVPMHFLTHELLLFATAVWTTNIHDCVYGGGEPVMGAGYHLIHHTTYKHNYGHYLTVCDWLFNTLRTPEEHQKRTKAN
mmetsp:Transcript_22303/g.49043  ORF Transcript_22303/g.49043 Transcript_22303/m.49043 type:complete len:354 (-) Transcript_22303:312-1373(-)|eukprot:CAMPEP_0118932842 /NCGR_PEP_ID=MMETSP1169-20130426/10648_1 /TAXON_ID=36882 /ORGANISM="Pyramimonas obovata, Strain CCMP722" /LENGTH=353 /DNA_ID=CAMNT_0006875543 /DNA_START=85 /DNA_END=1146 /DNA_ORIENTATION=+